MLYKNPDVPQNGGVTDAFGNTHFPGSHNTPEFGFGGQSTGSTNNGYQNYSHENDDFGTKDPFSSSQISETEWMYNQAMEQRHGNYDHLGFVR